jgi:small subunit ribosomal protein S1
MDAGKIGLEEQTVTNDNPSAEEEQSQTEIDDNGVIEESMNEAVSENEPESVEAESQSSVDNGAIAGDVSSDEDEARISYEVEELAEDEPSADAAAEIADEAVSMDDTAESEIVVADEMSDETVVETETKAPSAEVETVPAPEYKFKRGDLTEGTIIKTSPTSVTVDLGEDTIGVIPGRELERMSRQIIEELKEGETITVYVVNPHDHQGNVLLSVNRAIEELDWKQAESFRKSKDAYEGSIAGYNKGGLIVRFGSLRGFVPQSQVGENRRRNMTGDTPEELYGSMVGHAITVKVMEVDRGRNRLILSERMATRELRDKRKESLINDLNVGEIREGSIVSLEDFGAFVDVGGAEGLVHLTEISWSHVTHPRDILQIGQKVRVEVISVDRDRNRIGLSIKRQEADPWDEVATTYQVGDLVQGTVTKLTKFGAFARLVDAEEIEGLIHISELSEERVNHPRDVVNEGEKLTLRVVKIDVKNRRLGLSVKRVNSAEYLDHDLNAFSSEEDE